MSKYNIGDTVRIASAETIKARGCLDGYACNDTINPPLGFSWPCIHTMLRHCGTLHEIESKTNNTYRFTDLPCTWEDWMLDDIVPEIHMSIEEVFG